MTDTQEIQSYADVIIGMIKEDQASGQVPRDVSSWDELDDCVDTEDYLRQVRLSSGAGQEQGLLDVVIAEVGRRLSGSHGGPWHVMSARPGGAAVEIGRTLGYATRDRAETVGRAYLAEHGGTFHVRSDR
jgi:hypothetical protein